MHKLLSLLLYIALVASAISVGAPAMADSNDADIDTAIKATSRAHFDYLKKNLPPEDRNYPNPSQLNTASANAVAIKQLPTGAGDCPTEWSGLTKGVLGSVINTAAWMSGHPSNLYPSSLPCSHPD